MTETHVIQKQFDTLETLEKKNAFEKRSFCILMVILLNGNNKLYLCAGIVKFV
jgi:hypothetical protein